MRTGRRFHLAGIARLTCLVSAAVFVLLPAVGFGNPIPVGACCLPGGECQILPEEDCHALGGFWALFWECDPDPCPPVIGACCHDGGSCLLLTLPECIEDYHGSWVQEWSSCNPNPCPPCFLPCTGACCFPDGHCELIGGDTCFLLGGVFLDFVACDPDPCAASGVESDEAREQTGSWGRIKKLFR